VLGHRWVLRFPELPRHIATIYDLSEYFLWQAREDIGEGHGTFQRALSGGRAKTLDEAIEAATAPLWNLLSGHRRNLKLSGKVP
jgi:hypothetical protein